MVEREVTEVIRQDTIQPVVPQVRNCEWCHQPLPNKRYHLRICPSCRKSSIEAFCRGEQ